MRRDSIGGRFNKGPCGLAAALLSSGKGACGLAAARDLGGRSLAVATPLRCSAPPTHAAASPHAPLLQRCWFAHPSTQARSPAGTPLICARLGGRRRGRRCPVGALWRAASSAGSGAARAQRVLRALTCCSCLNAANEVSAVSSAARPRAEQRSAVGPQGRPPASATRPGTACRDPRSDERRTTNDARTYCQLNAARSFPKIGELLHIPFSFLLPTANCGSWNR